jgi:polyvinyl alcohol dehydrogenase (cytochrome)
LSKISISASVTALLGGSALIAAVFGIGAVATAAQQPPAGPPGGGGPPGAGANPGETAFTRNCAGCHKPEGVEGAADRAPRVETLKAYPPERIVDALTTGKMQAQGSRLSVTQHIALAEWLTGKKVGNPGADLASMTNRCKVTTAPTGMTGWNGWSPQLNNGRFQTAAGGVSAAQVPKLRLRWAFGIPGSAQLQSQPTVVGGWLYMGSDSGTIFALDADTGCLHWTAKAEAGVRTAPTLGPRDGKSGPPTVFVGDRRGVLYAFDAVTGEKVWSTMIDPDPVNGASMTDAPALYGNRLYVGLTGSGEGGSSSPCCKSRGQVAAVDTATGRVIWRTFTIKEPNVETSPGKFGPSGVGVWSTPTVDPKRRRVYVTTGNAYTDPATDMQNSVLALDMATGRILWVHQEVPNDVWRSGCVNRPGVPGCPAVVGPDYDFSSSAMLRTLPNGRDVLVAANKGGVAIALDPDRRGALVWRTQLWSNMAPTYFGDVLFGGAADSAKAYFATQESNTVQALNLRNGSKLWTTPFTAVADRAQRTGFGAAVSGLPGVVFVSGWDGVIHALTTTDGKELWSFDTARSFRTNNGVVAKGGSMGGPGVTVANGMVYAASGYVGVSNGMPGNVLLAFAP